MIEFSGFLFDKRPQFLWSGRGEDPSVQRRGDVQSRQCPSPYPKEIKLLSRSSLPLLVWVKLGHLTEHGLHRVILQPGMRYTQ